jgi:hypothetical protein
LRRRIARRTRLLWLFRCGGLALALHRFHQCGNVGVARRLGDRDLLLEARQFGIHQLNVRRLHFCGFAQVGGGIGRSIDRNVLRQTHYFPCSSTRLTSQRPQLYALAFNLATA